MKKTVQILAIGTVAAMLLASCSVRRDRERIEQAEAVLYSNRDSAVLLLCQVERPERMDDEHLAKYWFVTCDIHANSMQSLSEDSMICWAADYFRQQWNDVQSDKVPSTKDANHSQTDDLNLLARNMILSGLDEAMYWWWNDNHEKAQEVLQRQKGYADEVAERTGEHLWQVVILRVSAELAMRDYDYERVHDYTETLIGMDDGKAIHLDEVERVYNGMAITYFYLGEYDKMEECFEKAIAQASDSAFIVNVVRRNYADLLGEIGQTDLAIQMLEELTGQYRQADNWLQVESLYSLSRLWLNKGDKQRAERYMREAEELFKEYKAEGQEYDPATEAALLAHRQVLDYAKNGTYRIFPLTQFHNRWSEKDYVRYRIAEAKERSMRDLRERNLYLTISRQRQIILMIAIVFLALGIILLIWGLSRRRKWLLMEKEEELETLRGLIVDVRSDGQGSDVRCTKDADVHKLMLRQLGIIKTIAGTPTEANQHLLAKLTALDENKAAALIDWQSIYQTIDGVYNDFYTRLVREHGDVLNEKEMQLCCLLRAGFSTKEINMLTRQSMQTIYQRKTQVRQKLDMAEGDDIVEKLS